MYIDSNSHEPDPFKKLSDIGALDVLSEYFRLEEEGSPTELITQSNSSSAIKAIMESIQPLPNSGSLELNLASRSDLRGLDKLFERLEEDGLSIQSIHLRAKPIDNSFTAQLVVSGSTAILQRYRDHLEDGVLFGNPVPVQSELTLIPSDVERAGDNDLRRIVLGFYGEEARPGIFRVVFKTLCDLAASFDISGTGMDGETWDILGWCGCLKDGTEKLTRELAALERHLGANRYRFREEQDCSDFVEVQHV